MDLKALRYFEFVAELKSFSKAAIHLRVEQPALSRQVRKLEDELGVMLVTRHGRGVELTEAGTLLLARTKRLSREVSNMIEDVRSRGNELHGTVGIGAPPEIGDLLLPPLVMEAASQFPNLTLEIAETASPNLAQRLINNELSLAILHNPQPHRDLIIVPMIRDYLYLIGPSRELNGLKPVVTGQSPEGLPMILPRPPHNRRMIIDRCCIAEGIELDVCHHVDGFTIIRSMVEQGLGYSILSYYGVHELVSSGRISATPVVHPKMPWDLCVAYRRDLKSFKLIDALIGLIGLQLEKHARNEMWWPDATILYRNDTRQT